MADLDLLDSYADSIRQWGFAHLVPESLPETLHSGEEWEEFRSHWSSLPVDEFVPVEATQRFRRYGRLQISATGSGKPSMTELSVDAFQQSAAVMPLYGGRPRKFAAIEIPVLGSDILSSIVTHDLAVIEMVRGRQSPLEVGIHMIRVRVCTSGWSEVTPEGRHCDGHEFVAMHMIARQHCEGGDSVIYGDDGKTRQIVLSRPAEGMLLDDQRVQHEVKPIKGISDTGYRDMLILDFEEISAGHETS